VPADVTFVANDLRDLQPDLGVQIEDEVRDGVKDSDETGLLECRISERRDGERGHVQVHLEGQGWAVAFAVTTPVAEGEVKVETRRALRDRTKRNPYYRRATRR
jgi:hypothetical protein